MANKILYHGSTNIIEHPCYGAGKPYNDYGIGFYCTEHAELAGEWACGAETDGFINKYELDMSGIRVLDLTAEEYSVLNWLAILMDNRIVRLSTPIEKLGREYLLEYFLPEYKAYDLIRGYRADDSYFAFARAFVGNGITLAQLEYSMKLGQLGEQYTLKSTKAFEQIRFLDYSTAPCAVYYPKRKARDEAAREAFMKESEKIGVTGIYMNDILRERMVPGDERLQ